MIIGHDQIIEDLRLLTREKELSHGYIFFGPSMVGKRTTALAFANFLEKGVFEAPGENSVLQDAKMIDLALMKRIDEDVKNSIGIDAVRELKNFLSEKPVVSKYRTAIVDGGEILTTEAQNALLRITEEPPASTLLILTTSDADGLLPTISSRLQKIYFGTVPQKAIADWLITELDVAKKMSEDLAKKSFGKPGLAARLVNDNDFLPLLKSAEQLLKISEEKRKDFIKKLMEGSNFNFTQFLDALIFHLAWNASLKKEGFFRWHKLLALREAQANFSLNPKLQLASLLKG